MFYDQLIGLCNRDGISPTTLLQTLGMSKGSLANWKEGKLPTGEVLVRFSEHFKVSLDYLVNGIVPSAPLNSSDQAWLDLIHALPEDAQNDFRGAMRLYIELHGAAETARKEELRDAK